MASGADSIGHEGTCPHFYKWGQSENSQQETTKLYWPSRTRYQND